MRQKIIVYHNPRCSKSRETLALLEQRYQMLTGKLGGSEITDARMDGRRISFSVDGVRYTGETGDGQERLMTPSNTLLDALFAFEQGSWKYALNVNNLFDDDYVATCLGRGDCWFGTRRKVIGSVHYRF